jgi:RNA polymerase sigma-70 factor (ECF subfamily)
MKHTDEELLVEISKGSKEAFSEFYDRYSRIINGALLRLLKDSDNAHDILQEVFLQVWRKASTYKPSLGPARNWVVRIAHNRAINLIRSAHQRMKNAGTGVPEDDMLRVHSNAEFIDDSLIENIVDADRNKMLSDALGNLPPEQAKLISMAFFDGLTHAEISEKVQMPLGTVKTRIRNGLLILRQSLAFIEEEAE